jgi:hypothetical protein
MIPVVMGTLVGLYFFLRGCVLLQRRACASDEKATPVLPAIVANRTSSDDGPLRTSTREVVRLSPESDPDTSTQQGRIAAALLRAGVSSLEAWTTARDRTPVGVDLVDEQFPLAAKPGSLVRSLDLTASNALKKAIGSDLPPTLSSHNSVQPFRWKPALMVWGGPTLTLLCLYVLALHFGLL